MIEPDTSSFSKETETQKRLEVAQKVAEIAANISTNIKSVIFFGKS